MDQDDEWVEGALSALRDVNLVVCDADVIVLLTAL